VLGDLAAFSFHETKNIISGEGGALVVSNPAFMERAEIIREKGTNRSRFFRGQVDKYTCVDLGSSFLPSDILAALLFAQLETRESIQAKRRQIWSTYYQGLQEWGEENGVRLPVVPSHCRHPYHMFYLLLPALADRQGLIAHLKARGITSVFHYLPLHLSEYGRALGGKEDDCPVCENVSDRLLRLPFYNDIGALDQFRVIDAVLEFHAG